MIRDTDMPWKMVQRLETQGLDQAVADEKADRIEEQRPSIAALGKSKLKEMIHDIFEHLSLGEGNDQSLAEAYAHFGTGHILAMTARDLEGDEENPQVEALWRRAAGHFEECLRRDPSADEAARLLAVCAIRLGDGQRAIRAMTAVVRLNPEEFTAHRALAWTYIHAGRLDDGIRELRLALRYVKDPARRLACVSELVEQSRRAGRLEESVRLLEAERERPSPAPRLRILLAETYVGLGRHDRAIETCRRCTSK